VVHGEERPRPSGSAELYPGEETSGKLVSLVRQKADELAKSAGLDNLLIDGSPGIGCPVIASVAGVSAVILVTEPTLSGLHDLERIIGVVNHFSVPAYLVINKSDLNEEIAMRIEGYSEDEGIPLLGRIPYDKSVTEAMIAGKSAVQLEESLGGDAMRRAFECFVEASVDS